MLGQKLGFAELPMIAQKRSIFHITAWCLKNRRYNFLQSVYLWNNLDTIIGKLGAEGVSGLPTGRRPIGAALGDCWV